MNIHKQSIIKSTIININKAKITGNLNLLNVNLYQVLYSLLFIFKNNSKEVNKYKKIEYTLNKFINKNKDICVINSSLPSTPYIIDEEGNVVNPGTSIITYPISVTNLNTSNIVNEQILNGDIETADFYKFNISDFLSIYTDNYDNNFKEVIIFRDNLDGGVLRWLYDIPNKLGQIYSQQVGASPIIIKKEDLDKWSYYNKSLVDFNHSISFSIRDEQPIGLVTSNIALINVNRSSSENQPATIGDITIEVGNRETRVLNLAMFTSQLTPPYNDPENDLIDAIRIDEISTANLGTLKLNNVEIIEGTIITREQLNNNEFTYEGPDIDSIYGDSFNFSARDEGSLIWVK